ncbi:hypothetical protein [Amycolatopsis azurea]|uniref:Uncharacterized protein n=1 Tax=Amycolatopsis azurea DSM 43854 TaxID=1238180 RepID=M2PGB7_9PSEU|nr:hypothetical protein [Amycolatopsis azurea]EMD23403.1 hypothetical protein C791_7229 [Amycolatopsis azurea DSM 43854]OOC04913.1 hypothetical protein B0293_20915 [Amycolatopsis azurea DSM 43854]
MTALPGSVPGGRALGAVIGTCAAGGTMLSLAATIETASLFVVDDPFLRPMAVIVVPVVVHGMLIVTIVDSRHSGRRKSASVIAALFGFYLVAGTVWAVMSHSPGENTMVLMTVLQNTTGPLLLCAWRGFAMTDAVNRPRRGTWG